MRRALLAAALPLAAWAALAAAQQTASVTAWRQVYLAPLRIGFEAPSDWKLDDSDAQDLRLATLYGPWRRRLEHPKITVFHYAPDAPGYRSKDDYLEVRTARAAKEGGPVRKDLDVGGKKAQLVTLSFVATLGTYSMDVHREPVQETYAVLDAPQGGFFVLHYRAAQAIYPEYYPVFDRLLKTTRLSSSPSAPI